MTSSNATARGGVMPPLTPPECDLRGMEYMPVDVLRLRDSELGAVDDGEAFRAAILLYCAAWHQLPAASLPNDDRTLARLAGYGRDLATWHRARAGGALRGWIECSDGRLYHPVVAEKARAVWAAAQAQKARAEAARAAKAAKAAAAAADIEPVTDVDAAPVTDLQPDETRPDETRPSFQEGAAGAAPPPSALWTEGLERLRRLTGKPEGAARSVLGKLMKAAGDDRSAVLAALRDCPDTGDPVAWLMAACRPQRTARGGGAAGGHGWNLPTVVDPVALAVAAAITRPRLQ